MQLQDWTVDTFNIGAPIGIRVHNTGGFYYGNDVFLSVVDHFTKSLEATGASVRLIEADPKAVSTGLYIFKITGIEPEEIPNIFPPLAESSQDIDGPYMHNVVIFKWDGNPKELIFTKSYDILKWSSNNRLWRNK